MCRPPPFTEWLLRKQAGKHPHHAARHIAIALALMNKSEHAIHWLEAAAADGFPYDPLFELTFGKIRFIQFMARLRQQWADYSILLR